MTMFKQMDSFTNSQWRKKSIFPGMYPYCMTAAFIFDSEINITQMKKKD